MLNSYSTLLMVESFELVALVFVSSGIIHQMPNRALNIYNT